MTDALQQALKDYVQLILHFNKASNLVGPTDAATIMRDLVEDSLKAAMHLPPSGRALDVGSGAGIPGIPLALAYPDAHFTMVEPRKKRAQFIQIAANRLGIKDRVSVLEARMEDVAAAPNFAPFDWATSKAFTAPDQFLTLACQWTHPGAIIVSMVSTADWPMLKESAKSLPVEAVAYSVYANESRGITTWRRVES